jgi:hypothetical protein
MELSVALAAEAARLNGALDAVNAADIFSVALDADAGLRPPRLALSGLFCCLEYELEFLVTSSVLSRPSLGGGSEGGGAFGGFGIRGIEGG